MLEFISSGVDQIFPKMLDKNLVLEYVMDVGRNVPEYFECIVTATGSLAKKNGVGSMQRARQIGS